MTLASLHPEHFKRVWRTFLKEDEHGYWEKRFMRRLASRYILNTFTLETVVGNSLPECQRTKIYEGGCTGGDLEVLKSICRSFPECRYFEIGTWLGTSVMAVAGIASDCFTMDIHRKEIPGATGNITFLQGDSRQFSFSRCGKFNLIFIDGDHRYEYLRSDTKNVFRYLYHPGSVIVWHDCMDDDGRPRYEVLCGIFDGMEEDQHHLLRMITGTKCAIFIHPAG